MQLITALATPFKNGAVDVNSYVKLVEHQKNKVEGLLCCGTTAEAALLSSCERKLLIKVAKSVALNCKIWVGVSSGATAEAVKEAESALNYGADGILVSPPSFFKCTESGFVQHILQIKNAVAPLPIMLYNAPSRCGYELWKDALKELSDCGVEYIKDAGNSVNLTKNCNLKVLCGNEEKLKNYVTECADLIGVVSVVSNISPTIVKNAYDNYLKQSSCNSSEQLVTSDTTDNTALKNDTAIFEEIARLAFCELNPIPVKYMLYKMGIFDTYEMRLPLTSANTTTRKQIDEFFARYRNILEN